MVSVEYAFTLADSALCLCGPVSFGMDETSLLALGGKELRKPYLGGVFHTPSGPYYYLIVRDPRLAGHSAIRGLTLRHGKHAPVEFPLIQPDEAARERFMALVGAQDYPARLAVFETIVRRAAREFTLEDSDAWRRTAIGLASGLKGARLKLGACGWLTPSLLYLEGEVQGVWPEPAPELLAIFSGHARRTRARFFQTSMTGFSILASCEGGNAGESPGAIVLFSGDTPLVCEGGAFASMTGIAFAQTLNTRPDYQRHLIREEIARFVLSVTTDATRDAHRDLLGTLQYFVHVPPAPYADPSAPFSLFVEHALPVGNEGFFLSGWMRDPYHMLEEIELVSTLGFSLPLEHLLHRVPRPDVQESLLGTPYGGFHEDHGILAYVPVPENTRRTLEGVASLHGCRFRARLRGGIPVEVTPPQFSRDAFALRDFILKCTPPDHVSDGMLEQCIGPAAAVAQALCIREAAVRELRHFGRTVKSPKVSLVIPLYKRLDFLRVQCATFAADPSMREVEIIYVLDSPDQAADLTRQLEQLSALYGLAFTLVTMRRNAGYAAATNAGAQAARGKLLVLLNSDVFPKTKGWAANMAQFYESTPGLGALAPKLLYEDDSLQHAGMYFARTTFPFWINLHYFKGYPEAYARAAVSRAVPAVTGACLMMSRDLYRDLGGLATDYVIGDFEDSDLCLKAAREGLRNWYYADASLYHLERQSVPLNESYHGSLAWRYNARLHDRRWGGTIETTMREFS